MHAVIIFPTAGDAKEARLTVMTLALYFFRALWSARRSNKAVYQEKLLFTGPPIQVGKVVVLSPHLPIPAAAASGMPYPACVGARY